VNIQKEIENSKEIIHYKKALNYDMDWNEYINILNEKFNSEPNSNMPSDRVNDPRYVRKYNVGQLEIVMYNKLDPLIQNLKTETQSGSIQKIKEFLTENNINKYALKCVANLVGKENDYYIHYDNNDVLSFHLLGKAEYRIYKNIPESEMHKTESSSPFDSYFLEPGDVFFIPKQVCHQVVVSEPRVTILADYFND